MATYYAKRALEIIREDGIIEFVKSLKRFANDKLTPYGFYLNTETNRIVNSILYDSYPNPYKTIRVKTVDINYRNRRPTHVKYGGGLGQVNSGDWDLIKNCSDVEDIYAIRGIIERFEQKKSGRIQNFTINGS